MQTIRLREWKSREGLQLDAETVVELVACEAVDIRPDKIGPGRWTLSAKSFVGVLQLRTIELRIEPKVGVRRLLELLLGSSDRISWRPDQTPDAELEDDVDLVLAQAFIRSCETVIAAGLLQGYRRVEEALPVVRGRILVGAQMSKWGGALLPVEVSYDDYTIDVAENQLLTGALEALSRTTSRHPALVRRVRRALSAFISVSGVKPSAHIAVPPMTRLNRRYANSMGLAKVILEGAALSERAGAHNGVGFCVDMNQVFEDHVGSVERGRLAQGQRLLTQDTVDLDDGGYLKIRPDLLWTEGRVVVRVADVKYKDPGYSGVSTSDVYQALAYAHRFSLREVTLIYAAQPPYAELQVGDTLVKLDWVDLAR